MHGFTITAVRGLALTLGFVLVGASTNLVAQEKAEPLIDLRKESRSNSAPSPTQVEKAYTACLKGIDAEFSNLKAGAFMRTEARRAEEEVCHRARRDCITAPGGADCKGFVVDYAE